MRGFLTVWWFLTGTGGGTFTVPTQTDPVDPTEPVTPPTPTGPLELSDYQRRAGYTYLFVGLFEANEGAGGDVYRSADDLLEGDSLTIDGVTISGIGAATNGSTFGFNAATGLDTVYGPAGLYPEPKIDVQTLNGLARYDNLRTPSGFVATWDMPDDATIVSGIATDTRFIMAIYYASPVSTTAMMWDDGTVMEWDDGTAMEWDA